MIDLQFKSFNPVKAVKAWQVPAQPPREQETSGLNEIIVGLRTDIQQYKEAFLSAGSDNLRNYYKKLIDNTQAKISNLEKELLRGFNEAKTFNDPF